MTRNESSFVRSFESAVIGVEFTIAYLKTESNSNCSAFDALIVINCGLCDQFDDDGGWCACPICITACMFCSECKCWSVQNSDLK
jgi:hypothetical protein